MFLSCKSRLKLSTRQNCQRSISHYGVKLRGVLLDATQSQWLNAMVDYKSLLLGLVADIILMLIYFHARAQGHNNGWVVSGGNSSSVNSLGLLKSLN